MKKGLFMLLSGLLAFSAAKAQEPPKGPEAPVAGQQLVRLSKITVDPARLAGYNAFLQEEIEASLRLEPGVLALYAVAAKEAPGQVTILEIYADRAAYESHITTPHFRKYKEGTPRYGALPRTRRCRPAYARFGVAADGRYPVNSGAACLSAAPPVDFRFFPSSAL